MITLTKQITFALFIVILATLIAPVTSSVAAQVSQAQLEQFKKLPPSQQQALAKSMGVDINTIKGQLSSANNSEQSSQNTVIYPRGTQFDEQGNPLQDKEEKDDFEEIKKLAPFGYDVFANSPQTFAPTMDIAIPSDYMMGPGDKISIQVFGKETNDLELEVNREGQVVFPQHGPFTVSGLSFSEMKKLLSAKIKEKIIGVDVVIGMASLRSMRVFVLGDAYKPGPYTLSSLSSITHAIFAAGGISDIGSLRNIQLKRAGKLVTTLDLYDLLIRGDSSNDILLKSGDVVFISSVGKTISIDGEVRRPAIYELIAGDNFVDVTTMAGGLLPSAYAKSTIIERYNQNDSRSALNVDFTNTKQMLKKAQAGDHISVMKSAEVFTDSVTLIGAITRPGKYQWKKNQKITDLLPDIQTHLLTNADLNYSLIVREVDIARNIEVLQFSLVKAMSLPESDDNIYLQANDKILIFSQIEKLIEQALQLDELAFTQEQLSIKEQQLAKEKFKKKQFWLEYGDLDKLTELKTKNAEAEGVLNKSVVQIVGQQSSNVTDLSELTLFSRQRLLFPIIDKIKRQSASGQPLQLVEIDGEVKYPGIYPLVNNARVDHLISAAGGFKESAYSGLAELTRSKMEGITANKISKNIELSSLLAGDNSANILLKSKDRLNVHKIPAWSENLTVELKGEFVFPGRYTIRRGETLSELITKAGGFTEYSHQEASVFTRSKLKTMEKINLEKLSRDLKIEMASKSLTDTDFSQSSAEVHALLADITKVEPVGRLVLNLPKVVKNNDYDVMLENGDILYVPLRRNAVNVMGQVQVPTSHVFDANLTVEDYLAQSGGSKKRADESRIYIISANGNIRMATGSNWFASDTRSNMKPGDTIVVPLDSEYMTNLTLWNSATTIIYQTAVAIAAISGL